MAHDNKESHSTHHDHDHSHDDEHKTQHPPHPVPKKKVMIATQEEMEKHRVPLAYRDYCAHLLIKLNECRIDTFYLPWKCKHERHAYEKCEYDEYAERIQKSMRLKEAAKNKDNEKNATASQP